MRQFKPGQLQTGSVYPITSSYAMTASYVAGISFNTSSLVTTASFNTYTSSQALVSASIDSQLKMITASINTLTSSYNSFTSSYTTGSFTGSFRGDGSGLTNLPIPTINTSSLVTTASFNAYTSSQSSVSASFNTRITNLETFSSSLDATFATDAQLNAATASLSASITTLSASFLNLSSSYNTFIASYNTGSFTGSFTGRLIGTASWAQNSVTASFVTASNVVGTVTSSSYAISASYLIGGITIDTGSLVTTASFNTFTSSIQGQVNSLTAATSSYTLNSVTASMLAPYVLTSQTASMTVLSASFATTSSYVTASNVYGPYGSNSIISSSYAVTASLALNSTSTSNILVYVKNVTGAPIPKGKVVRISGATGDNALISTASWDSDGVSANTLGILNETIADQAWGYAMTEGKLLGIDTDTFTAGQLLFLGPTGSIINTEPRAPLHAVRLGQALRIQQNNGSMYVRIDNGYELDELHNVLIISGSDGDLLVASGSNGNGKKLYINSKQLTGSYAITGSLTATSFTGSLYGTATTASYVVTAQTASYVLQSVSASFATTASYITSSNVVGTVTSASYAVTASYVLQAISSSFATTASFVTASNVIGIVTSASSAVTASFLQGLNLGLYTTTASFNAFTASYSTGSFTGSFTGPLTGTASWASNSVTSQTASFVTASNVVGTVVSASYALTASYAMNGGGGGGGTTFIRRSDYTTTADPNVNYLYLGDAASGSLESQSVWSISRLAISSSGATTPKSASSVAWTDRYTVTYL